ncbi:MAG: hypothetical protein JXX29_06300 [Deltaproteobacteria bacterium]|nr:hypothetical protein [Deltaproteobacteria bacterium]MBN2671262.1 hypothetical protein [Deltaproteobacteria bacterium]
MNSSNITDSGCHRARCFGLMLLFLSVVVSCSDNGDNADNHSNEGDIDSNDHDTSNELTMESTVFPASLAVASPLAVGAGSIGASGNMNVYNAIPAIQAESQYKLVTTEIQDLLDNDDVNECVFDPHLFFTMVSNAACYGPAVWYENHPDAPSVPNSGQLPPGDLGIWLEYDENTGDACAAAELNARMQGIQARVLGALTGLASMVCVVNATEALSLPDSNISIVDLADSMPASETASVNSAELSFSLTDTGLEAYSYTMDMSLEDMMSGNMNASGAHIVIQLTHIPNANGDGGYQGRLTYRISLMTDFGSNCPPDASGTPVTRNGSVVYDNTSGMMRIEMREGQFCGSDIDGLDVNYLVDATRKFDPNIEPNGWGDDFNLFRAAFEPSTQLGDYAYAWQAGHHDGNTRVFNLSVFDDGDDATDDLEASAFFGYGADASEIDPRIQGFIFNWAGPGGGDHALQEYAQRQQVRFNTQTETFESVSANITYAPTHSGNYDGTGSFTYDADADGFVDTNPTEPVVLNLASGTDDGTGTATIEQTILDAGVTVPDPPVCTACSH